MLKHNHARYDGDGNRVKKSNGKLYWNGDGGEALDETDASGNLTDEYIFFGGKRIARRDPSNNVDFYFADHLGTARVVTNASGTVQDDSDFYPFGGERPYLSSSGNSYKFTGKERDAESGLDDFGARYYSSALGRFASSDWSAVPAAVPYANFGNPQTLNLYSYVKNNPLTLTDPNGHCDWCQKLKNLVTFRGWVTNKEFKDIWQAYGKLSPEEKQLINDQIKQGLNVMAGAVTVVIVSATEIPPGDEDDEDVPVVTPPTTNAAASETEDSAAAQPKWNLGGNKSAQKWQNQMQQRGWTPEQINDAITNGQKFPATNNINPANGATRYVNPQTGRSVVVDNKTGEVLHVGGDGFKY